VLLAGDAVARVRDDLQPLERDVVGAVLAGAVGSVVDPRQRLFAVGNESVYRMQSGCCDGLVVVGEAMGEGGRAFDGRQAGPLGV
jgi:hypothetical protein